MNVVANHQHITGSKLQGQPLMAKLLLLPALLVLPQPYLPYSGPYLPL